MLFAGSPERVESVIQFARTFVPGDVSEDDIVYFSSNLANDEVRAQLVVACPR